MEGTEEPNLLLTPFAPLIQLWAGICLLFFYETLFKRSPLSGTVAKLKDLHRNFTMQYIDFIPQDELMDDSEFVTDNWEEDTLPTIKNIAALTFFYCVFILTYIGIEDSYGINREYFHALQPINIAVIIYAVLAFFFNKWKVFHTYWTPVIAFVLMIFYFHAFRPINEFFIYIGFRLGDYSTINSVYTSTLFTLYAGLASVSARLGCDAWGLSQKRRSMQRLDRNCKDLTAVLLKVKPLEELPKSLLLKIQPELIKKYREDTIDTNKALLNCIKTEITAEYRALKIKRTQVIVLRLSDKFRTVLSRFFSKINTDSNSSDD